MTSLFRGSSAAACATAFLALAPSAFAAPQTIDLRIEGPNTTLFEGPVTTDVRTFHFTSGTDTSEHRCDATATENSGPSAVPVPTRGGAVVTAAEQSGFDLKGTWFAPYGPSFSEIKGENVDYDGATGRYLVEYRNWQPASVGACADQIATGDEHLLAYGDGSETLLRLTGPATAKPGQPFAVKVTNGGTGAGVGGASVAGATSADGGDAQVTLTQRGNNSLKAQKAGAIRSNALTVCVTDGADGYCGTTTPSGQTVPGGSVPASPAVTSVPDRTAPRARIASLRDGRVFSASTAPRVLRGKVDEAGGVLMVKLRLTRTYQGRCWAYSGRRERFIRRDKCGAASGWWFKVGDRADWEYQLASKLGKGRYVLDVNAIDKSYNRDDQRRRGENRVVFTVR